MKNYLLIPGKYKGIGWATFLLFAALYVFCNIIYPKSHEGLPLQFPDFNWSYAAKFDWANTNLTTVLLTSGVLAGLLMICFSKEKDEDEYISFLRLQCWQWAVLVSYGILFVANWLIYGDVFLGFMMYNMLTVLVVFIIKFNYSLYCVRKGRDENEK
jgi:hypothetical protein